MNIYSGSRDSLGAALTNMTERAREKGKLTHPYPVRFRGLVYADAEAAYQALKVEGDHEGNDLLMAHIIAAKLLQHERLFMAVQDRGGAAYLQHCSHFTGARSPRFKAWEGQGVESRFIRNLVAAYRLARTLRNERGEEERNK